MNDYSGLKMKNHETEKNTKPVNCTLHLSENPLKSYWSFYKEKKPGNTITSQHYTYQPVEPGK